MGCSKWRAAGCNFGHLRTVQSKVSVFLTMIILFTYLFYCLTGYCDSLPRPISIIYDQQQQQQQTNHLLNNNKILLAGGDGPEEPGAQLDARHRDALSPVVVSVVRGGQHQLLSSSDNNNNVDSSFDDEPGDNNISIANNFGSKKFPQAIIIGVKKGGTRALLEFLRVHPDVRAVGAEPHFFDRFYDKGLEWYRNLMPRTLEGQITMEKTPSYFITKEAPRRVFAMSRHARLIVVVRDPVTRAVSDYTQTVSKSPGLPSFQNLAFRNSTSTAAAAGLSSVVDTSWSAVRIGIYAKHLENWLRYFPLQRLLFVSGERLVSDPAGEMGRVQDFLGLKRVVTDKHFYFNRTKGFPCLKKPEGSSRPRCLGKSKGRTHPQIPSDVLLRLRDFYRPFNLKFYQMTGQDFGWE